jgi:hypothetical protein
MRLFCVCIAGCLSQSRMVYVNNSLNWFVLFLKLLHNTIQDLYVYVRVRVCM